MKMTHMEGFHYPVWEAGTEKLQKPMFVLFDYQIRNPLNGDAKTVVMDSAG